MEVGRTVELSPRADDDWQAITANFAGPKGEDVSLWLRAILGDVYGRSDSLSDVRAILKDYEKEVARLQVQCATAEEAAREARQSEAAAKAELGSQQEDLAVALESEARYTAELAQSKVRAATLMEVNARLERLTQFYAAHIAQCCPELLVSPGDDLEQLNFDDARRSGLCATARESVACPESGSGGRRFNLWKAIGFSPTADEIRKPRLLNPTPADDVSCALYTKRKSSKAIIRPALRNSVSRKYIEIIQPTRRPTHRLASLRKKLSSSTKQCRRSNAPAWPTYSSSNGSNGCIDEDYNGENNGDSKSRRRQSVDEASSPNESLDESSVEELLHNSSRHCLSKASQATGDYRPNINNATACDLGRLSQQTELRAESCEDTASVCDDAATTCSPPELRSSRGGAAARNQSNSSSATSLAQFSSKEMDDELLSQQRKVHELASSRQSSKGRRGTKEGSQVVATGPSLLQPPSATLPPLDKTKRRWLLGTLTGRRRSTRSPESTTASTSPMLALTPSPPPQGECRVHAAAFEDQLSVDDDEDDGAESGVIPTITNYRTRLLS